MSIGRPQPVRRVLSSFLSGPGAGQTGHTPNRLGRGLRRAALSLLLAGCASVAVRAATAPTFVQVAYSTPSSPQATVKVAYPSAQTAGDLNVVVVGWNDTTSTIESVTDSAGNVYRLAIGPTVGKTLEQSIYYASGIAGGTNTVTVTFSQAATYPDVRVLEYRGVSVLDVAAGNKGNSATSSSGAATTSAANELIVGANTVATVVEAGESGYTVRVITQPDADAVEDKTAATAGSNNAKATLNGSGPWVMQMVAFAAASAPQTPGLDGLTCSSGTITGAATDACTLTLTGAAPSGGLTISLASNSSALTVPASVTVASGATSAAFTATAAAVTTAQTATLTANVNGVAETFSIQLNAAKPALTVSAASLAFGNVTLNTPSTQTVTLTSSGTAAVTVSAITVSGTGFSISGVSAPVTLNPGATATLTVVFDPTTSGAATGAVTISDNASPATATVSLSGTGTATAALSAITCNSSSLTGAATDACTVTLTSTAPSGGVAVALSSSSTALTVPASVTVASGSTSAAFTATATAVTTAQTATLTAIAGSASKTFSIQLNAATPALTVSTSSVSFGDVDLNSPAVQTVTLTSSGTAAVTVSAVTAAGTGFSVSGVTAPLTLNPGATATLDVEFDPTASGAATGTVTISDNASPATATISLSGTGQAAAYQVELSWDAPGQSTDPVAGYAVYRAASGSSTYQLVGAPQGTGTSYTDTSVANATSYVYYVVSVDAQGNQSSPSNTYPVTIP